MVAASLWTRFGDACGVPPSAYDVANGARSVDAFLCYDRIARPLSGRAVLLNTHLLLSEAVGGKVIFAVALQSVRGMRCSGRLQLPGKVFDCPTGETEAAVSAEEDHETAAVAARRSVSIDIFHEGAAVTLRVMGAEGEQFARAALLQWRINHTAEKAAAEITASSLFFPGDAVYALAGAPVHLPATVVQCLTCGEEQLALESGEAVEILMLNEKEICIARRPQTAATFWRDLHGSDSEKDKKGEEEEGKVLQVLPVDSLSALLAPVNTSVRLVGCRGEVWLFTIPDPATNTSVRHALQRLIDLFLLGMMRSRRCGAVAAVEPSHGLRYFDIAALYQQYCAMDVEGAGYLLCSSLEAAMGPLLACDSRLMQAMVCHDDNESDNSSSGRVSLSMYLNHMRILLQGSLSEHAKVAFRAFGGDMVPGEAEDMYNGNGSAQQREEMNSQHQPTTPPSASTGGGGCVRVADFNLIVRDILAGLVHTPVNAEESVDDNVNKILASLRCSSGDEDSATMTFQTFLRAYTILVELLGQTESKGWSNMPHVSGMHLPLLGFGSAHWVPLTYVMTGLEISVRASTAESAAGCGEKNTFDLTAGTPTIAGVVAVPNVTAISGSPNFFSKRFSSLQSDRVTFTDYAPQLFASVRRRFGISEERLLSALGISALRARLLLGYFCAPRVLRSSGRSGALLLSSHDYRFILKRVTHTESRMLRGLLPAYVDYLERYPHTLLPQYAGLYALWRGGEKTIFVVTGNVFATAQLPVVEVYDLKGSTLHRTTAAEDRRHGAAAKDNDFLADKKRLRLTPAARRALLAQLEADTALLEKANRLDYSLLVGIHSGEGSWSSTAEAVKLAERQRQRMEELAESLEAPTPSLQGAAATTSSDISGEKLSDNVFHAYYGGVASADGKEVYYLGIVDCLTSYSLKKVGEHYTKSVLLQDMNEISCVPPPVYRSRFLSFMRTVIED